MRRFLGHRFFGYGVHDYGIPCQPFGFKSGLYDSDTGLVHFGARWYDPVTGRWISKDPILLAGGLNLYAFCGNDPGNYVDPLGLCEEQPNYPGYWDRYIEHLDHYAIKLDPVWGAGLIAGGVMPKSWASATGGRGPLLGSKDQLTSVLRGFGVAGAGSTLVSGGVAVISTVGVGIGTYNSGVMISGLVYALFPGANGL